MGKLIRNANLVHSSAWRAARGDGMAGLPQKRLKAGYPPLTGEWEVENIGIAPDFDVEQDPALVRKGRDPQLEGG